MKLRLVLPYLFIGTLMCLMAIGLALVESTPAYGMDDAYIVLHNAQVLKWGYDPNYVGTSALSGTTSPVHLLLVYVLQYGLPETWPLFVAGWLATLAYMVGLVHLSRIYRATNFQAVLLAVVGGLAGMASHQLTNGLETGLAMASIVWAVAIVSEPTMPRARLLCFICGLMPFIRPELGLVSFGVLFLLIQRRVKERGGFRFARKLILVDLGLAIAMGIPFLVWFYMNTGSPLQATASVKEYYFAQGLWPLHVKIELICKGIVRFFSDLGVVVVGFAVLPFFRVGLIGIVLFLAIAFSAYIAFPGALDTYEGRYLFPLLPFAIAGLAWGVGRTPAKWTGVVTFALCVLTAQVLFTLPGHWQVHKDVCHYARNTLRPLAEWCQSNLPKDSNIMIHDAGYIAYGTDLKLIDLVGLKTPWAVEYHRQYTYPSAGKERGKAIDEIARRGNAEYLIALESWVDGYELVKSLREHGWSVEIVNDEFVFDVYRLHMPAGKQTENQSTIESHL